MHGYVKLFQLGICLGLMLRIFATEEIKGCYLDSSSDPNFYTNPGIEDVKDVSLEICAERCSIIDTKKEILYAGIQFNECLCATKIEKENVKSPDACSNNHGIGKEFLETQMKSIRRYEFNEPILNCGITESNTKTDILSTVECTVTPENPNVKYTFNFGDGGISTEFDATPKATYSYILPGEYKISVAIILPNNSYVIRYTTVEVFEQVKMNSKFQLQCPRQIEAEQILLCNITEFSGTNVELKIKHMGDDCPDMEETLRLPNITKAFAGLPFPLMPIYSQTKSLINEESYIVLSNTYVITYGVISTIKVHVISSGKITLKVLRPKISSTFCPNSIPCQSTDEHYTSLEYEFSTDAKVDKPESVNYPLKNGLEVQPGDLLAIQQQAKGSAVIGYREAIDGELSDFTLTKSLKFNKLLKAIHFVQAVITPKFNLFYGRKYQHEGVCTLQLTLQSKPPDTSFSKSTQSQNILIGKAKEDFNLTCDKNSTNSIDVSLNVTVSHVQKFKKIFWNFGDGGHTILNYITASTEKKFQNKHTYEKPGRYTVLVKMESEFTQRAHNCTIEVDLIFIEPEWNITSNSPRIAPNDIKFTLKYWGNLSLDYFQNTNITFKLEKGIEVTQPLEPSSFDEKSTFTLIHPYKEPGIYNVQVILTNQANRLKLKTKVEMLEKLRLKVVAEYFDEVTNSYQPGFGPDVNLFRQTSKIRFTLTCEGANEWDTFTFYKTSIDAKNKISVANYSTHYEETFNETGTVDIEFHAVSKARRFEDAQQNITLNIEDQDWNFDVFLHDYFDKINSNEEREFRLHSSATNSCVVVDFADGSKFQVFGTKENCERVLEMKEYQDVIYNSSFTQFPINVTHKYAERNNYNVTLTGYTSKSFRVKSEMIFVNYYPFRPKPFVWILINSTQYIYPLKIYSASGRRIETGATLAYNNSHTLDVRYGWTIWSVDKDDGVRDKRDTNLIEDYDEPTNKSYLYLRPRYLPYGLYKIIYNYSIEKVDGKPLGIPLMSWSFTYVEVTRSPIIPIMINNSVRYIERSFGQMVYLYPTILSIDPDGEPNTTFFVKWICQRKGEKPGEAENCQSDGCFSKKAGVIKAGNIWALNTSSFCSKNFEVTILANVSKGINETAVSRFAIAFLHIKVVPKSQNQTKPVLTLRCGLPSLCRPLSDVQVALNPNLRLSMIGECIEDCPVNITYKWTFSTRPPTTDDDVDHKHAELIGHDKNMVALEKSYLKEQSEFDMTFNVLDNGKVLLASTTMHFYVDKPPEGGVCNLTEPDEGRALVDRYKVECKGWLDPDGFEIATYKVYSEDTSTNFISALISSSEPTFDLILKPGVMNISIHIADFTSVSTIYPLGTIEVKAPTREEYQDFIDNKLLYLRLTGNQYLLMQAIQAILALQKTFNLDKPDPNFQSEEHAKLTEENINFLKDLKTITFNTMNDLEVVSNTAAYVVGDGYGIDKAGRGHAVELITQLDDVMKHPDQEAAVFKTPVQSKKFLTNALSVIGGIAMSTCNQLANKKVTQGDFNHANEIDVDTRVDVGNANVKVPKDTTLVIEKAILDDAAKKAEPELKKFNNMLGRYKSLILSNLVAEEEPIIIDTLSGLRMRLERSTNQYVRNENRQLGNAAVEFPDFCDMFSDHKEKCQDETEMAYAITLWNCIFPAFGYNFSRLNNASTTIDVEVYTTDLDNATQVEITNSSHYIFIAIPRRDQEQIILPEPTFVTPKTKWFEKMVYHQIKIKANGSSVDLLFSPDEMDPNFLLFLRYNMKPYLDNYDLLWDTKDMDSSNGTFLVHVDAKDIHNYAGKFYLGVVQLFSNATYPVIHNKTVKKDAVNSNFTTNYTMYVYASGCHFYLQPTKIWNIEGCAVEKIKTDVTTCKCTHLTKFASSFIIAPNPINFQYVFTHAGFLDNTTIYATIIATLAIFILFLIWARYQDRKDVEKLGALPLPDNKPDDKYIYEILVFTGTCKQAGTESKVSFVLTGDMSETDIRTFGTDFSRKTFCRGGVDVFVMTEPRPLGQLLLLRIWHDNSGEGYNASWYLNYIVIRDVQTGEKFEFIADTWFAVEKGDRQIERAIPVADKNKLSNFDHLFNTTGNKKVADGHLWTSVFTRRPRSRFTRCQRVATCAAFLYLAMVTNAMWYQRIPDKPHSGFRLGPFSLGLEEIAIGFASSLVTFPPIFLLIFLFQKSKPFRQRRSRIDVALDEQRNIYGHSSTSMTQTSRRPLLKFRQTKGWRLPWFCRIIAWLLCIAIIGAAIFFLWAYGIQFGDTKTKKWLTALVISFITSLFVTQPIKVFLTAVILSAICKKVETDEDDADEDEDDPHLNSDERWLHETECQPHVTKLIHTRDTDEYENKKQARQKEVQSRTILKEIFIYVVFISIAVVISYGTSDPNAYWMVTTLKNGFVLRTNDQMSYMDIKSPDDYWSWIDATFMSQLRVGRNYANMPPFGQQGFLADSVNRIMGNAILRQVRIKPDECEGPIALRNFTRCSGSFSSLVNEDDIDYDIGWQMLNETSQAPDADEDVEKKAREKPFTQAFQHSSAAELKGVVLIGNLDAYSGGGYVYHLTLDTNQIREDLRRLNESNWIDERTRAIFIEFSVYNAQVNLFGVVTLITEFIPGGGIVVDYIIDGIQLLSYETKTGYFVLACEIIYLLFITYFAIIQLRTFFKQGRRYFKSYANLNELLLIICSYAALAIYIYRFFIVEEALNFFKETKGSEYVNLQKCKLLTDLFSAAVAFAVFFGILKFINLLRFNHNILTLSRTLIQVAKDLWGFGLILLIIVIAYGFLSFLVFCITLTDYSSFYTSIKTLVSVSLNKFDFKNYVTAQPFLGPIIFFSFSFIMSIILINLLITIIIQSFENIKHRMAKVKNEVNVIDYVNRQLKNLLNKNSVNTRVPPIEVIKETKDTSFSQKMDTMLGYINSIFFDNKLDLTKKFKYRNKTFNFDSTEIKSRVYNSN